jgi:hypothetical protein
MQILIQNRQTKAYVDKEERWTANVASARPFQSPYEALYFCVSKELDDTDIVYRFGDGREVRFLRC